MNATTPKFQIGDKVVFLPGPRSKTRVTGKVTALNTGLNGKFMDVTDAQNVTRKVRPGAAKKAA